MNSAQRSKEQPRIVVGVDGFESSKAALRWAIRQARLTGGLAEALLGSVGQYCVHHAPCPVVIMRGKYEG
jgi:nucleotide-binding universal stress UspA family protein